MANPALDDYGCTRPIRVAVFEFGPWYHDGAGITADLLEVIASRTGCSFEPVPIARAAAWAALAAGDVDVIPNSIRTEERLKLARFVTFLRIRNLMIVRADADRPLDSLDAFVADRNARLGVIRGFLYGSYFDLRLQSLLGDDRMVTVDDPRELVDLLRQRAVDAVLLPSGHYFVYLSEMERQAAFRVLDTSSALPNPSGFAFARNTFSAAQSDNWLRVVESLYLHGTIEQLVSRHLPPRIAATIVRR